MDDQLRDKLLSRITVRPDVFGGKPIIRDMRISAESIVGLLAQGASFEELLDDYPRLEHQDILACLAYAYVTIRGDSISAIKIAEPALDGVTV